MVKHYSKIGELLVDEDYIRDSELNYALKIQRNKTVPRKIGQILIEKRIIEKEQLRKALGIYYGVETIDITNSEIETKALKLIDIKTAFQFPCLPYKFTESGSVKVALSDPKNFINMDILNFKINYPIIPVFAFEKEIINEIRFYSSQFK